MEEKESKEKELETSQATEKEAKRQIQAQALAESESESAEEPEEARWREREGGRMDLSSISTLVEEASWGRELETRVLESKSRTAGILFSIVYLLRIPEACDVGN